MIGGPLKVCIMHTPSPHLPAIIELTRASAFLHFKALRNSERSGPGSSLGKISLLLFVPLDGER